jgi:hypothetical protein
LSSKELVRRHGKIDLTSRPLRHRKKIPVFQQQNTGKVTEFGRGGGKEISSPAQNRTWRHLFQLGILVQVLGFGVYGNVYQGR